MIPETKLVRDKNTSALLNKDSSALAEYKERKRLYKDINNIKEKNIILEEKLAILQNKYDMLEQIINDIVEKVK